MRYLLMSNKSISLSLSLSLSVNSLNSELCELCKLCVMRCYWSIFWVRLVDVINNIHLLIYFLQCLSNYKISTNLIKLVKLAELVSVF